MASSIVNFAAELDKLKNNHKAVAERKLGRSINTFYRTIRRRTPTVRGEVRKAIRLIKNGARISFMKVLKENDKVRIAVDPDYAIALDLLERGAYKNPGKAHWYHINTGILIKATKKGFYIIRTDYTGASLQGSGMLEKARRKVLREIDAVIREISI